VRGLLTGKWRDIALLTLLSLTGLGVKGWLCWHTDVVSRDGIHYISYAARLRQTSWPYVFRHSEQHPMYPIHVLAAAEVVQTVTGRSDVLSWQYSAQLANLLTGVLLAIPMYFLGKTFFGSWVGFGAALLFQCLPVPARVTADALSEGTFLLWGITALLFAVWGLQTRSPRWFVLSGLTGGIAYLTRPEGALILLTAMLVLCGLLLAGKWQGGWRSALICSTGLAVACLALVGPYWCTIGGLSPKPSVHRILEADDDNSTYQPIGPTGKLFAARLTPGVNGVAEGQMGVWMGLKATVEEVGKGFHYVLWIPALLGGFWLRRRYATEPGLVLLGLLLVGHLLVLWRLAATVGYVSERHTLLIVVCGLVFAAAALRAAADYWLRSRSANVLFSATVVLLTGIALVKTCHPMHAHRLGHKEAGFWLAAKLQADDQIVDPYGWVTFYSGRTLNAVYRGRTPEPPVNCQYLVIEPGDRDVTRLGVIERAEATSHGRGDPIYAWPQRRPPQVVVYQKCIKETKP
jgi:hypothetical protein